jgi:two-component system, LytTR family, sensor kinase
MKAPSLYEILDLRKLLSHLLILFFSIIVTLITSATGKDSGTSYFLPGIFVMLFAQLEAFIFLGHKLFANLNFNRSPHEITSIVLIRFVIFLAACLFISMILFVLLQYMGLSIAGEDISKVLYDFIHNGFGPWFRSTIKGLTIGAIIFIVLLWQTSLRREQKLREENLIFQNETLKSQVNPHFLFNSLNTVSSLIQTHPEKAEQFINNLSSVYRYVLENGQKDKVPLQSELDLVNRYFDLHRVRDEEKIVLSIDYTGADNYQILPVSLQILIENAIKHNSATRENPLKISISFEGAYVLVSNSLQKKATEFKSTGIGLRNLTERVRLVTGKELIIEKTNDFFTIKIPLLK